LAAAPPWASFAPPPVWRRLVDKEPKMSRTVVAIVLCLLLAINIGMLALNLSRPSQAAVAGLKAKELDADPDFVIAVKAIVGKCTLNINLAALKC
jgi:hypothetical protein